MNSRSNQNQGNEDADRVAPNDFSYLDSFPADNKKESSRRSSSFSRRASPHRRRKNSQSSGRLMKKLSFKKTSSERNNDQQSMDGQVSNRSKNKAGFFARVFNRSASRGEISEQGKDDDTFQPMEDADVPRNSSTNHQERFVIPAEGLQSNQGVNVQNQSSGKGNENFGTGTNHYRGTSGSIPKILGVGNPYFNRPTIDLNLSDSPEISPHPDLIKAMNRGRNKVSGQITKGKVSNQITQRKSGNAILENVTSHENNLPSPPSALEGSKVSISQLAGQKRKESPSAKSPAGKGFKLTQRVTGVSSAELDQRTSNAKLNGDMFNGKKTVQDFPGQSSKLRNNQDSTENSGLSPETTRIRQEMERNGFNAIEMEAKYRKEVSAQLKARLLQKKNSSSNQCSPSSIGTKGSQECGRGEGGLNQRVQGSLRTEDLQGSRLGQDESNREAQSSSRTEGNQESVLFRRIVVSPEKDDDHPEENRFESGFEEKKQEKNHSWIQLLSEMKAVGDGACDFGGDPKEAVMEFLGMKEESDSRGPKPKSGNEITEEKNIEDAEQALKDGRFSYAEKCYDTILTDNQAVARNKKVMAKMLVMKGCVVQLTKSLPHSARYFKNAESLGLSLGEQLKLSTKFAKLTENVEWKDKSESAGAEGEI